MQLQRFENLTLTDKEKEIYNAYLRALAEAANRAYKKRIDFSDFESESAEQLKKLNLFFNKFRHIMPYNFFKAGLYISEEKFLPLSFFNTYKAISCFTKYNKVKYELSADSDESIKSFKEGVTFICEFLKANRLSIADYRTCVNQFSVPWYAVHLKEQRISFYHLHAFGISKYSLPQDYKELVCSGFDDKFNETLRTYQASNKLKQLGNKIKQAINK